MQLREFTERLGAELLDHLVRLLLHQGAGAFLEFGPKFFRKQIHLPHKFRPRHHRRSRHHRIGLRFRPHFQIEIFHALFREFALHEGLLGKLVQQTPRHGFCHECLLQRRGVLPREEAIEVGTGPRHQVVVFRHPTKTCPHHRAFGFADELVEQQNFPLGNFLRVLDARLAPHLDGRLVGDHRRRDHRPKKVSLAALVEPRV